MTKARSTFRHPGPKRTFRQPRRKRACLPFAGSLISAWLLLCGQAGAQPENAALELTAAEMERLGIQWAEPERLDEQAVLSVTATAVVPPEQEVVVSAPVGGLVTRLLIAEGSEVEAGDPLLELRSLELLGAQREFVDAVSASRLADAQRERDSLLHEEGIIAQRRVDESESEALAARIRAEQAREHLRIVGAGDDELEELASSGRISAAVTLRAPGPGVVLERHGAVGEQVEALEPLVRLADLKRMWLEARVPQERADAVTRGMRLVALVAGAPVGGEIFQVGRVVDPVTQTVIVRAAVDNADQRLRADQVLRARVLSVGPSGAGTYAAPMSAIVRVAGTAYVFERMPTGLRLVPVTVHGEEGSMAHFAADGLGAGSEIAVRGVSALKALLEADDE